MLNKIPFPSIVGQRHLTDDYWKLIREGLYDPDQAARKLSIHILKMNLKI